MYYRDLWIISNPTDQPLSFEGFLRIRDQAGNFVEDRELPRYRGGCPGSGAGPGAILGYLIWIPPLAQVVLHVDTPAEEVAQGLSLELYLSTVLACPAADRYGRYDPRVTITYQLDGDVVTAQIYNGSDTPAVGGVLYVSAYGVDGAPLYGGPVDIYLSGSGLGLPPGEVHADSARLPTMYVQAARYEFIWVGMSE